jgi:DNA polymerase-1
MNKLYVVDAVHYLFRSYFAIRSLSNEKGVATNAVYGFIRSLQKLIKDFEPNHLICVFDGPDNKKSRTAIYPAYKSHRPKMADDLFPQIALAKEYLDLAGIPHIEVAGVEADDTMGSIAKWAEKNGIETYLCSSDKDLAQLVSKHVFLLNNFKENLILDGKGVFNQFGVRPEQMIDYLAIMGDTSDNIPGIAGFGPKAAVELLEEFGSLNNLLENVSSLTNKKRAEKILLEKENALLSQKLATIQTDVKVPHDIREYLIGKSNTDGLAAFYREMHFTTLLKELPQEESSTKSVSFTPKVINDMRALEEMLSRLKGANSLCIDTETTSLKPLEAKIVGIGIAEKIEEIYYIPFNGRVSPSEILAKLTPFLERKSLSCIGHNIKYDMHVLKNHGITLQNISFDTMIASYLLHAHEARHNLDTLSLERLHYQKVPIATLLGKKGSGMTMEEVPLEQIATYCAEDVFCTLRLKEIFEKELKERDLESLFRELEMPLLPILFRMERRGIFVEQRTLRLLSKEFAAKIDALEKEIFHLTGTTFNLNSPKQLGEVLFDRLAIRNKAMKKTKTGYSTSAEVLDSLRGEHPAIDLILTYRSLDKLKSTYVDKLQEEINPVTHRIHSSFNQSVTATGRLSSTDPNLQNIPVRSPEGKRIREAFIPETPTASFLSADYSQIELRILAHLTEDPHLIAAFCNDEDIHEATAALVFDVPLSSVTKEMRFRAKAVNFGILYGQGPFGLSASLAIPFGEASTIIETYFKRYPKVKGFLESCKEDAMKSGKAVTLFGRERILPDINSSNGMLRSQALRLAVNTPIQGTQADIIKKAMLAIDKTIAPLYPKNALLLQIHDELIFEIDDEKKDFFKEEVRRAMEGVIALKVPLKVDISFGKNWGEC